MNIRLESVRGSDPPTWRAICINAHSDLDIGVVRQPSPGVWTFEFAPLDADVEVAAANRAPVAFVAPNMKALIVQIEKHLTVITAPAEDSATRMSCDVIAQLTCSLLLDLVQAGGKTETLPGVIDGIVAALALIVDRHIKEEAQAGFAAEIAQHIEQRRNRHSMLQDLEAMLDELMKSTDERGPNA